jgi:hypothetical protein
MKQLWLALLLAAAACGGTPAPTTTPPPTAGPAPAPAPTDAALAARTAYEGVGGKWMPRQIRDQAATLTALGLAIDPAQLADPLSPVLGAVVFTGSCSASFISPEGLIVTNHHCVQGALQYNSTTASNLVEDGFLARTRGDEKSGGPGERVYVAQAFLDVTDDIQGGLDQIADPARRFLEIERREKALIAGCEKGRPAIRCRTGNFFRGHEWQLIEYLEIQDVRLVYVPHRGVGNYGGDIDNWAWPRHTADFAMLRAYVGKDGQPAPYAADNVPFRPRHWLKVQPRGVVSHDLVFSMGYPRITQRLETMAETRRAVEWDWPRFIAGSQQKMAILNELVAAGGETAIKAGVARQTVQNYLEKTQGMLAGLTRPGAADKKAAVEASFQAWAAADPSRATHREALAAIDAELAAGWASQDEDKAFEELIKGAAAVRSVSPMDVAMQIVRMAEERPKPDAERKTDFQDRDLPLTLARLQSFGKKYDRTMDRRLLKRAILNALELSDARRPWLAPLVARKRGGRNDDQAVDAALDRLYAGTQLEDPAVIMKLYQTATTRQLKASKDPFIQLALALTPHARAVEAADNARKGKLALLWPVYMAGLIASQDGKVAPDANGTLRISFGTVRGFQPRADGPVFAPFTTAKEILGKNTGTEPFDAPARLLAAIQAGQWGPYASPELGELPANFISTLDTTNGNSGSPVVNGRGELVGVGFDRNLEGVASDVVYDGARTRVIAADIRYLLWIMDAVDGADHLLQEIGVTPALDSVR